MKISARRDVWLTGIAIFSMYFGAGNFALPMLIGSFAASNTWYAGLGFILTAILVPTLGLISMLGFQGDYRHFLAGIGKWPGFVLMIGLMAFIGPLGALPRCISMSYETLSYHIHALTITQFSLAACILIFAFSVKKSGVIDVLGKFLTPILLAAICIIVGFGLFKSPQAASASCNRAQAFWFGFTLGPQTLDLFASLFFAAIVLPSFTKILGKKPTEEPAKFFILAAKSCLIGMGLLALVYWGLTVVASRYCSLMPTSLAKGQELSALAHIVLGEYGALVSGIAVALACLTTAIALAVVFSEFVEKEIFKGKVPYLVILAVTMIISFIFARIGFAAILGILAPWLEILYPAAFVLVLCNLAKRFVGFSWIKLPFYTTVALSILWSYFR